MVGAAVLIPRLEFRSELVDFVETSVGDNSDYAFRQTFATLEITISSDSYEAVPIEPARQLHTAMLRMDGVVQIISPFRFFFPTLDGQWKPVLPLNVDASNLTGGMTEGQRALLGPLLQPDRNLVRLLAVIDQTNYQSIADAVSDLSSQLRADGPVEIFVGGLAPAFEDLPDLIARDQTKTLLLSLLFGFTAALCLLRDIRIAALIVAPPLFTLTVVLGVLALFQVPITVLTISVTTLLLVVGVADALHLYVSWVRDSYDRTDPVSAMTQTLSTMTPVIALTTGTTGVCFLAVGFVGSDELSRLGFIGALGCLLQFFSLSTLWPAILLTVGKRSRGQQNLSALFHNYSPFLFGRGRSMVFVMVSLLILAGLVLGQSQLHARLAFSDILPQNDGTSFLPSGSDDHIEPLIPIQLALEFDHEVTLLNASGWEALVALERRVRTAGLVVLSPNLSLDALSESQRNSALTLAGRANPFSGSDALINVNRPALVLMVPSTTDIVSLTDQLFEIAETLKSTHPIAGIDFNPFILSLSERTQAVVFDLRNNAVLAMLFAVLTLTMRLKSWRFGLCLLVCNALPVMAVLALAHWCFDGVGIEVAMAATIAFGVALDDSIHTVSALKRIEGTWDERNLKAALKQVGPVLITTTGILTAGMCAMFFSDFPPVERYGLAIIGALLIALFCDLILFPALVRSVFWLRKRDHERA